MLGSAVAVILGGCTSNPKQRTLKAAGLGRPQLKQPVHPGLLDRGRRVLPGRRAGHCSASSASGPAPTTRRPSQIHGNTVLEVTWTDHARPLLLAGIAIPTVKIVFDINQIPKGAMQIDVTGHRWWWQYDYTDATDPSKVLFSTANEMHIPAGQKIELNLTSVDVIHNFWPPRAGRQGLRHPRPAQPHGDRSGSSRHLLTASAPSTAARRTPTCGSRSSPSPPRTSRPGWPASKQGPAQPSPNSATPRPAWPIFNQKGCAGCHSITGISSGQVGPRPDPFQEPHRVRGLHLRQHRPQPPGLAAQPAGPEARLGDAQPRDCPRTRSPSSSPTWIRSIDRDD